MNVAEFYQDGLSTAEGEVKRLEKKDRYYSAYRLIFGTAFLVAIFFALMRGEWILGLISLVALIIFTFLVRTHQLIRADKRDAKALSEIMKNELASLDGNFRAYSEGSEFKNPKHHYSEDLDLFGPKSLFQRLNRTQTLGGESKLAAILTDQEWGRTTERQTAVTELSGSTDWMLAFRVTASRLKKNIPKSALEWGKASTKPSILYKSWLLWPLSLWFPALLVVVALTTGFEYIDWLLYPFLLNLLIFSSVLKQMKKDHQAIDTITKDLAVYGELLAQFESVSWESAALEGVKNRLNEGQLPAHLAIHQLAGQLQRMDSFNNAIGALLFNGLVFYHLHVYRNVLAWRKKNGARMEAWLEEINELEASVSLGFYHFNHPQFNLPTFCDETTFEASDFGHPFLSKQECVTNDVSFEDWNMIILTGSNMAGKSTFLRSIGLSIVMARAGLPVRARSLRLSRFHLLSSMKPQDNINENTSYFQAEIMRLRSMMDVIEHRKDCFVLLDEILRGTNSEDKREGTKAFLLKLSGYSLKGVVATHDVEIAQLTSTGKQIFTNMYFESTEREGELNFDYKLRDGICTNPNATILLRQNGLV